MTWLQRLSAELTARGIPRRERARIVLEFEDHIACEPGCEERLGDPRKLAAGFDSGLSLALFVPAFFGMFLAPQVALVAGTLAALRALRRRRVCSLPASEIGLIGRRTRVALLAGFATVAGLELYAVDFSLVLPAWYLALVAGSSALVGVALGAALIGLNRSRTIVSCHPGAAGDVYDDLPIIIGWRWLRRRPWRLGAIASLTVAAVGTVFQAHAERSLAEGLQRGIAEGFAAAVVYAALGRAVGLFSDQTGTDGVASRELAPIAGSMAQALVGPDYWLAADEDRSRAEQILRRNFAHGRLDVDELTARVSAMYDADTIGELRAALSGLPGVS